MLYLPNPSATDLKEYYESIKKKVDNRLAGPALDVNITGYLREESILMHIITDKPEGLLAWHDNLMRAVIPGYSDAVYDEYFNCKDKEVKDGNEQILFDQYDPIVRTIESIFDYNQFISSSKKTSYDLAKRLNRHTCTYCNRIYTNTVIEKNERGRFDNDGRITRPQFDHWFAKSRYPLLSVSYFNLIPSCAVCNSSIKGATLLRLEDHVHPYCPEDRREHFSFSYTNEDTEGYKVTIKVEEGSKMENTLKVFKIEEVYNAHSNLELKDLLDLKFKYSDDYLITLFTDTFSKLSVSHAEAYRMVFGVEHDEEDFYRRPFSKFKKDILKELEVVN